MILRIDNESNHLTKLITIKKIIRKNLQCNSPASVFETLLFLVSTDCKSLFAFRFWLEDETTGSSSWSKYFLGFIFLPLRLTTSGSTTPSLFSPGDEIISFLTTYVWAIGVFGVATTFFLICGFSSRTIGCFLSTGASISSLSASGCSSSFKIVSASKGVSSWRFFFKIKLISDWVFFYFKLPEEDRNRHHKLLLQSDQQLHENDSF